MTIEVHGMTRRETAERGWQFEPMDAPPEVLKALGTVLKYISNSLTLERSDIKEGSINRVDFNIYDEKIEDKVPLRFCVDSDGYGWKFYGGLQPAYFQDKPDLTDSEE